MSVRKLASPKPGSKGFTVIELVTVVMVVGVVTAIAVPSFRAFRINSQISAASGDMVSTLNQARSLAISTRSPVVLVQGPGVGADDVDEGDDWGRGWRVVRDGVVTARVQRIGGNSDVNVLVTDGAVSVDGTAAGSAISGLGFNNFGQLIASDGTALTEAAVVICAPDEVSVSESGRAISISRIGRIRNAVVTNPASCEI